MNQVHRCLWLLGSITKTDESVPPGASQLVRSDQNAALRRAATASCMSDTDVFIQSAWRLTSGPRTSMPRQLCAHGSRAHCAGSPLLPRDLYTSGNAN